MDKNTVVEGLRALAHDKSKRTKAGCLRELLDDVEATLASGVSQAEVIKELNRHGLEFSFATFVTTLKRLRKERARGLTKSVQPAPESKAVTADPNSKPQDAEHHALTRRERGLKVAEKYLNAETISPLTKRLLEKQQETQDESSGD